MQEIEYIFPVRLSCFVLDLGLRPPPSSHDRLSCGHCVGHCVCLLACFCLLCPFLPNGAIQTSHCVSKIAYDDHNYNGQGLGVIVTHPWALLGGSMENNIVVAICAYFQQFHITTLRFNFAGKHVYFCIAVLVPVPENEIVPHNSIRVELRWNQSHQPICVFVSFVLLFKDRPSGPGIPKWHKFKKPRTSYYRVPFDNQQQQQQPKEKKKQEQ